MQRIADLYPPPGRPSNPPTWEDFERLALTYPTVHLAVTLVERGDLTREQALVGAVYALAEAWQALFKTEVARRMREPPDIWVPIIAPPPSDRT